MPTYTPLQSIVLTSPTSSVTFSSIPQGYTDIRAVVVTAVNTATYMRFNSDSGSNYSLTEMWAGTSANSERATSISRMDLRNSSSTLGNNMATVDIMSYSNSVTYKTVLTKIRDGLYDRVYRQVQLWRNTAAITTITFTPDSGNFPTGSTFDLYAIGVNSKATGGLMIADENYWYHIFTASSSFTTTRALTCDVLSVGGGGGGGWNNAGGGGGGEVDILTGLSIASGVTKTVTIGGGGATATSTSSAGANGVTTSFASDTTSLGGGGGGTGDASAANEAGQTGGSGGGGALSRGGGSASGSNTNIGGTGFAVGSGPERYAGGGGGGATSAGGNANTTTRVSGTGGQGYALANIFSGLTLSDITHFGSGGSGGIYVNGASGTAGTAGTNAGTGGQQTSSGNVNPTTPTANAGGGGGGGAYTSVNSRQGSAGASGIVIVRYPV